MEFQSYFHPDFEKLNLLHAPDARLLPVEKDFVAPENYHATSIFPEYFKVNGQWILAEESRMDCVAVWTGEKVRITEFRHLKKGDLVFIGRTEDGSEGIYMHTRGFASPSSAGRDAFAFRQGHSREMISSMIFCAMKRITAISSGCWARRWPLIPIPGTPLRGW